MGDNKPAGETDDVATTLFGVELLEATRDRPIRPNLPWLRNMSHTKVHALILGVPLGLLVTFGYVWGEQGAVVGLGAYVIQYLFGRRQKKSKPSTCEHNIGAHDAVRKPWYFFASVLLTIGTVYMFIT